MPVFKADGETYTEEFYEYIPDTLDLIEFANGEVTTKWGNCEPIWDTRNRLTLLKFFLAMSNGKRSITVNNDMDYIIPARSFVVMRMHTQHDAKVTVTYKGGKGGLRTYAKLNRGKISKCMFVYY